MSRLGEGREFDLIRAFLAQARGRERPELRVGPGDDCAILTTAPFAISSDMSMENVHFRRAWLEPREIGYRAAVAALSDLAAVGAQPVAALVSFAFSSSDAETWATEVMAGVAQALDEYDAVLAGGDVTRSDAAVIDVVVIGSVEQGVLRSGARIGDDVWVTGSLGGAAAAVAAWLAGRQPAPAARARYARPAARIREGRALRGIAPALIDVSDGVAGDARHLAAASGCGIVFDAGALPVHADATPEHALSGGEDYELLFTAPAGTRVELAVELTKIGEVVAGTGLRIRNGPQASGYDHFGGVSP
ncbi:MAG: thiamine-phosphate kinase [Gemmatimonadota bacterium]